MREKFKNRAELVAAIASGRYAGRAVHTLVLHDEACTPGVCVCEPEFVIEELTPENFLAGERAQADWVKKKTS